MTAAVVAIARRDQPTRPPRAVRIPEQLTYSDIDDVLYEFGFEWFGPTHGVQRLVSIDDDCIGDCIGDCGDALDVMHSADARLALFDRDAHRWVPLAAGDWVVEPQDERGDGFIRLSAAEFDERYVVVAPLSNAHVEALIALARQGRKT